MMEKNNKLSGENASYKRINLVQAQIKKNGIEMQLPTKSHLSSDEKDSRGSTWVEEHNRREKKYQMRFSTIE